MTSNLMVQLNLVMHPCVMTYGTRAVISITQYEPKASLRVFLEEVLPTWAAGDHATEIRTAPTETDAARSLYMLQIARDIHLVLHAYDVGIRNVFSTDTFEQSPVIVQLLQVC